MSSRASPFAAIMRRYRTLPTALRSSDSDEVRQATRAARLQEPSTACAGLDRCRAKCGASAPGKCSWNFSCRLGYQRLDFSDCIGRNVAGREVLTRPFARSAAGRPPRGPSEGFHPVFALTGLDCQKLSNHHIVSRPMRMKYFTTEGQLIFNRSFVLRPLLSRCGNSTGSGYRVGGRISRR